MRCSEFAFALLLGLPGVAIAQTANLGVPELETVGTGERRVVPDRAVAHVSITTKAASAAAAANANSQVAQAVRDTLKRLGLDSAVTTASYNVGPDWETPVRNDVRTRAYAARTVIRIRLSRLDQIGKIIDAALAKGATGVDGVEFESSGSDAARRAALAEASLAARRDAEALASALGGTVGPLLSASTAAQNDARRMNVMLRASVAGGIAGTQIRPDEIVITAGVVTRWQFIPNR